MSEEERKPPALVSGAAVKAIVPTDFDGAWRIAVAVTSAGMAPKGLDKPEQAMVAIMHGMEVGMTPMAALQSIAVVNGRPTIWGDGAIGLVRGSGKMEAFKETIEGTGDKMVAICEVKRKGEENITRSEFSVDDAKKANLWGKTGPWTQYPKRMLAMRARAFALRDTFADVLRGLGITEEVQDYDLRDVTPTTKKDPPAPPVEAEIVKPKKDKKPPAPKEEAKVIDMEPVKTEPVEQEEASPEEHAGLVETEEGFSGPENSTGEQTDGEAADDTGEEEIDLSEIDVDDSAWLTAFEATMKKCQNVDEITGVWADWNPGSRFPDDLDTVEIAKAIRTRYMKLVLANG